jgi:ribonuclease HII
VTLIVGVAEVGRGCLAGPVYAVAVVFEEKQTLSGLKDSKLLSKKAR